MSPNVLAFVVVLAGVLAAPAAVTAAPARLLLQAPDTLAGAITADANLSTLLAAVNVTTLPIDVSSPETAVLLFAPSNAAHGKFLALIGKTPEELLSPGAEPLRKVVLTYHVVPSATVALTNGAKLKTALGATLTIRKDGDKTYVEDSIGSKVLLGPERIVGKSRIRPIEAVLLPPLADVLKAAAGPSCDTPKASPAVMG